MPESNDQRESREDPTALERPLVKLYAHMLLIVLYQLIHCVRPYNFYNDAAIQEIIENTKFERSYRPKPEGEVVEVSAAATTIADPTSVDEHSASNVKGVLVRREPFMILIMKLLLRARIDLLRRFHAVLERDSETLERLGEEQARHIDRLRCIYEDFFIRMIHMEELLHHRSVEIIELRQRLDTAQLVSADGTYVWNIDKVANRLNDAITGRQMSLDSPAFFVHRYGYKMCLRLYLNGEGLGQSTHMSLLVVVMRSPWDALLRWPFKQRIMLLLYDQNFRAHVIDAFNPDDSNTSFRCPENLMNIASGSSLFLPLCMLHPEENQENAYIRDDRIYVKVIIDCADLPSLDHAN